MAGSTASNRKNKKQGKKNTAKAASSRTKKKASGKETASEEIRRIQSERESRRRMMEIIWGLIYVAVGAFLFFSVQFSSLGGKFGAQLGLFLKGIFGLIGLLLPWYLIVIGILLIVRAARFSKRTLVLSFILLLLLCLLNSGRFIDSGKTISDIGIFYENGKQLKDGGFFGMFLGTVIVKFFGKTGLYIFSGTAALISLVAMLYTPWQRWWENRQKKQEEAAFVKAQSDAEETQRVFMESDAKRRKSEVQQPLRSAASELAPPIQNAPVTEEKEIAAPSNFLASFLRKEPKKSNAADFLSQSDPFAETRTKGGHGFEEPDQTKEGFGLEDRINSSSGIGLNPSVPPKEGYGLTDERPKSSGNMPDVLSASNPGNKRGAAVSEESLSSEEAETPSAFRVKKPVLDEKIVENTTKEADAALSAFSEEKDYKLPDISLLDRPVVRSENKDMSELQSKAAILQRTLHDFNVDAQVTNYKRGPAITRYEIQPGPGVKVSKIVHLADDIALNMRAKSIRVEAPIPGKAAVGIEVSNDKITPVRISEVISSDEFQKAKSKIEFAVGKDIAGNNIVANLKDMPHLLIAGSTGSGKSVCINSIIASILFRARPDEVKLVLIDPKVVELGIYNGIPHLLIPVVTDPAKAAAALQWAVGEMTKRYKKFAEEQTRDIASYNRKKKAEGEKGTPMPEIVIIIDELADLMMAAPSQVQEAIVRIAQLARAAGMHLVVATQRPSVDIITGLIKANIPSRIAFAVSSQFDSRTILDMNGAEKLVGKGDMLFHPLGMGKPLRVQGTFISDEEVNRLIAYVKAQRKDAGAEENAYDQSAMDQIEHSASGINNSGTEEDSDELLPEAIQFVIESEKASTSLLQRRFRIGYNRAARMMDELEVKGIVGPPDGSRPRNVLVKKEELNPSASGSDIESPSEDEKENSDAPEDLNSNHGHPINPKLKNWSTSEEFRREQAKKLSDD